MQLNQMREGAEEEPVGHCVSSCSHPQFVLGQFAYLSRPLAQNHSAAVSQRPHSSFILTKEGSQDLFEQLERARDYLKEWAAKWFAAEGNYFAVMGPHCAYIWHTNEPNVGIHMPYVGPMGIDISRTSPAGGTDMRKLVNFQVPSRNRC